MKREEIITITKLQYLKSTLSEWAANQQLSTPEIQSWDSPNSGGDLHPAKIYSLVHSRLVRLGCRKFVAKHIQGKYEETKRIEKSKYTADPIGLLCDHLTPQELWIFSQLLASVKVKKQTEPHLEPVKGIEYEQLEVA